MAKKLIFFALLIFTACGENESTRTDILSEDEMTNVLLDIYITEAKVVNYTPRLPRDTSMIIFDSLKMDVLDRYNLSDSLFKESLQYYFQRPDELDVIYGRIIDSLNLKIQKTEPRQREEP